MYIHKDPVINQPVFHGMSHTCLITVQLLGVVFEVLECDLSCGSRLIYFHTEKSKAYFPYKFDPW